MHIRIDGNFDVDKVELLAEEMRALSAYLDPLVREWMFNRDHGVVDEDATGQLEFAPAGVGEFVTVGLHIEHQEMTAHDIVVDGEVVLHVDADGEVELHDED